MQSKILYEIKVEDAIAILALSLFLAEVINILHRISKINSLNFEHCNNSSLWLFQAKEFYFTVTFIVNTLIIKLNQKTSKQ